MTSSNATTAVIQRHLDAPGGDTPADPIVRVLLDRAVCRLEMLCSQMLHGEYPRLARSPLGLEADDVLGAVVERLLKALRGVCPPDRSRVPRTGQPAHAVGAE